MAGIVHIVDDDAAVLDSLRFVLTTNGLDVRIYASAAELLAAELQPLGCVLTDFQMPGIDGLQLQHRLAQRGVALPVILMTAHADVPVAVQAMKAGAVDVLLKPFADGKLLDAVQRAVDRSAAMLQHATAAAVAVALLALLTPREREVLDLLVAGRSNKEIGKALGTSPRTIDVHRARVFQKLRADSLPDLVRVELAARAAAPAA